MERIYAYRGLKVTVVVHRGVTPLSFVAMVDAHSPHSGWMLAQQVDGESGDLFSVKRPP
jgi:hypothetical protein